ncbi:MAG: isoprenylcysteine carboxylmethyltransferase family protein [Bacteroidetes bacterium]|nr:isoprenylcysteine carboxylmethyltransferase family protein [Bacteroidota bacterium]
MSTLIFALVLIAYYALHSLLAADRVKAALSSFITPRYYRLWYNLMATALFAALVACYFFTGKTALWSPNRLLPYPGGLLVLSGAVWVFRALGGYNLGEFTGLAQLKSGAAPKHESLKISGLNAQVRHPLYFGTLLIIWGVFFIVPTDAMLVFCGVSMAYVMVGSRLEERKLVAQFGEAYQKYQIVVPMLVPFKWRKKRL